MQKLKFIIIFIIAACTFNAFAQTKKTKDNRDNYSKIELSFSIGYSRPLLEAYGNSVTINAAEDRILIDGKALIESDNFGTNTGYGVQTYMKYSLMKQGRVKALFNLGYNILLGIYPGPSDFDIGVRIQTFSVGIGSEINPLGHNSVVYPAVFGLMRMNFMGGEDFHRAGLDFFEVTPRYGYTAGFKVYFRVKNTIDLFTGYSYSYDNAWSKQNGDNKVTADRTIVFRDEKSASNGLTADRRVAYWGLYLGMNFFFK
ncbi:MAG: hypothetical protein HOP31_12520 [Ignavibacteria bacterium]|nr:hypothetical protein [Ignavibacteria bacterium]